MNQDTIPLPQGLPSARKLATTTAIALAVAGVLLVTCILPAEYGIDPLRTGRALGLTAISGSGSVPVAEVVAPSGPALAPVQDGPIARYGGEYKIDSAEFVLGPYEFVEYKYHLEKGASMLYSWTATETPISDFHGDPDGGGKESTVSYDKQPKRQANGMFTAPFSGIHGWYWENPGGSPLTVTVTTGGFYGSAIQFLMNRRRRPHALMSFDVIAAARKAAPAPAGR